MSSNTGYFRALKCIFLLILFSFASACISIDHTVDVGATTIDIDQMIRDIENNHMPTLRDANPCEEAFYAHLFGENPTEFPDRFLAGIVSGSTYAPSIPQCPDLDVVDNLPENIFPKRHIEQSIRINNQTTLSSECSERFKDPQKVTVKKLAIELSENTLNLKIPPSKIYFAKGSELSDESINEQGIPALINNETLKLAASISGAPPGHEGELEVTIDETNKDPFYELMIGQDLLLVLRTDELEMTQVEDDGQSFFLTPRGSAKFHPKITLTIHLNLGDLGCIGELG